MYHEVFVGRRRHRLVTEATVAFIAHPAHLLEPFPTNPQLLAPDFTLHAIPLQLDQIVTVLLVHEQPILLGQ